MLPTTIRRLGGKGALVPSKLVTGVLNITRYSGFAPRVGPDPPLSSGRTYPQSSVTPPLAGPTMDFRPRETLFFGDNFFKLVTIGFKFSHHPFQPKRRYPSIWSLDKISKCRVPVIDQ